jgi:hypothetical protein
MLSLHGIAASRGDGLRPELLEVLARQRARTSGEANVADIAQHRDSGVVQAGPNPVGPVDTADAENVVMFPRADEARTPRRARAR